MGEGARGGDKFVGAGERRDLNPTLPCNAWSTTTVLAITQRTKAGSGQLCGTGLTMIMQSVKSSNLNAVGYDVGEHSLFVDFKSGRRYKYVSVPAACYRGLIAADSPRRVLLTSI